MPILPPEPDIFPDHLLDGGDSADDSAVQWWALYTLSRREKELMRRLRAMGICHYGPLIKQRRRSPNGRLRTSHVPLFRGYVFLCGGEKQRCEALTTGCVSRSLAVSDGRLLVRDLKQIRRLIQTGAPVAPESRLEPGTRVRIRSGPLLGMEGTVIKRRGTECLLLAVGFLQQGASVQLEDFQVERID